MTRALALLSICASTFLAGCGGEAAPPPAAPTAPAGAPTPAETSRAEPTPSAPGAPKAMSAEETASQVRVENAERHFPIGGRDAVLGEIARAAKKARAEAKAPAPARIFGVRADGLLAKLGLENGDRLIDIDGSPTTSDAEIDSAIDRLKSSTVCKLHIERAGAAREITLRAH